MRGGIGRIGVSLGRVEYIKRNELVRVEGDWRLRGGVESYRDDSKGRE